MQRSGQIKFRFAASANSLYEYNYRVFVFFSLPYGYESLNVTLFPTDGDWVSLFDFYHSYATTRAKVSFVTFRSFVYTNTNKTIRNRDNNSKKIILVCLLVHSFVEFVCNTSRRRYNSLMNSTIASRLSVLISRSLRPIPVELNTIGISCKLVARCNWMKVSQLRVCTALSLWLSVTN